MLINLSSRFSLILKEKHCYIRRIHNKRSYKVLFFGSDGIALSSLRKINEFKKTDNIIQKLDLVTANNSKNKTIIEKYAYAENLNTVCWPIQNLSAGEYDIGLIVAFGHLIKDDVLNKFPMGMVNVHPSLLPRWRGAAPIIHTLLNGDVTTGVTLMKIKPDVFDVGEIISQIKVPVPKDILLTDLTEQLSEIGAEMLVKCIKTLPESLANAVPQSEHGVTYARKITKSICEVRWSQMNAIEVYNLYRATYGLYSLRIKFRDKQVKLFNAFLDIHDEKEVCPSKLIGTLEFCENKSAIKVLCKDRRYIYFRSLRVVGKREITAIDFYNGYIKNIKIRDSAEISINK